MKQQILIAGVDEAGRGALAGPIVAGAVIFMRQNSLRQQEMNQFLLQLNDSKKLTVSQREKLFVTITSYFDYGLGIVSAREIDMVGIKKSTQKAMNQAVKCLANKPQKLLIDGCDRFQFRIESEDIIKGDEKIPTIAAASIIAKVTRDQLMREYHKKFPMFGFKSHKGYGTKAHIELLQSGIFCEIHRQTYDPLKTWLNQGQLFSV